MDFITPITWAMILLTTKVIEKSGENLGDKIPELLGKFITSISQHLKPELNEKIRRTPELLNEQDYKIIRGVVEGDPKLLEDVQKLSVELKSNVQLVKIVENFTYPNGVVPINSPFYIRHDDIESRCQKAITEASGLLRIQASLQMGKTSLLERLTQYSQENFNYRVARIDLRLAETQNLDLFLQWLCRQICKQSNLPNNVKEQWDLNEGAKQNCTDFIENYILKKDTPPLLLCIDNLQGIYKYDKIFDDFFTLLRSWYEKQDANWSSLRMIFLHVSYVDTIDQNKSPFNVGEVVRLPYFTKNQVQALTVLYGIDCQDEQIVSLIQFCGGHPFLIRLVLYEVAHKRILLQDLLKSDHHKNSLYSEHLKILLLSLERERNLKEAMAIIIQSDIPLSISYIRSTLLTKLKNKNLEINSDCNTLLMKLTDLGLIKLNDDKVEVTNQLYKSYFRDQLRGY
jgi:hypothetical protein